VYLSPEAFARMPAELVRRRDENSAIVERIAVAREYGNTSESGEYETARDEQALNQWEITKLEMYLRDAVIVEGVSSIGRVEIGSTVVVWSEEGEDAYVIVETHEADPSRGLVSDVSPMGSPSWASRPATRPTYPHRRADMSGDRGLGRVIRHRWSPVPRSLDGPP
jgi:transcription elongation factor GreA